MTCVLLARDRQQTLTRLPAICCVPALTAASRATVLETDPDAGPPPLRLGFAVAAPAIVEQLLTDPGPNPRPRLPQLPGTSAARA